jgi:hypothetical protein
MKFKMAPFLSLQKASTRGVVMRPGGLITSSPTWEGVACWQLRKHELADHLVSLENHFNIPEVLKALKILGTPPLRQCLVDTALLRAVLMTAWLMVAHIWGELGHVALVWPGQECWLFSANRAESKSSL